MDFSGMLPPKMLKGMAKTMVLPMIEKANTTEIIAGLGKFMHMDAKKDDGEYLWPQIPGHSADDKKLYIAINPHSHTCFEVRTLKSNQLFVPFDGEQVKALLKMLVESYLNQKDEPKNTDGTGK